MDNLKVSKLEMNLRKAGVLAFTGSAQSSLDKRAYLSFSHIRYLQNNERKLPKDAIEEDGLLFDRTLLHYSTCYRVTRRIAKEMGIKFEPTITSTYRNFLEFDPSKDCVPLSPIAEELEWLLSSDLKAKEKGLYFRSLTKFTTAVYHELNHYIFYRLLRPVNMRTEKQVKAYFALSEALTTLREFEMAKEIGYASLPLSQVGVMYAWLVDNRFSAEARFDFQDFESFVHFMYLHTRGLKRREIERRQRALKIRDFPKQHQGSSRYLVDTLSPEWLKNFRAKHKEPWLRLEGSRKTFREFKVDFSNVEKILSEKSQRMKLYEFYSELFWTH